MADMKDDDDRSIHRPEWKTNSQTLWKHNDQLLWKTGWLLLKYLNMKSITCSNHLLLGIYPPKCKEYIHTMIFMLTYTMDLLMTALMKNNLISITSEWLKKKKNPKPFVCIHIEQNISSTEKDRLSMRTFWIYTWWKKPNKTE